MTYRRLRRVLFRLESEQAHDRLVRLLEAAQRLRFPLALLRRWSRVDDPRLRQELWGLEFPNPVGLAAGFDKNGRIPWALAALGFGHLELGTVTLGPRPGNPRPRIFRLVEDEALINRLGFPNEGAQAVAARLRAWAPLPIVVGINLGTGSPGAERPEEEYAAVLARLAPHVDYAAVNLSSPNTPGLRELQTPEAVPRILEALHRTAPGMPILVKLSPDLSPDQVAALMPPLLEGAQGVIATNTTLERPPLRSPAAGEAGGLSGRPLQARATQFVRQLYRRSEGRLPIIGVGGVFTAGDAWEKITAGASLIQLYTGLVYEGPGVAPAINRGLLQRLEAQGASSLSEIVGTNG